MDIQLTLEYPPPILSLSKNELIIEAKKQLSASFVVINSGGGTLEGRIVSPSSNLKFNPSQWTGNRQEITCDFLPQMLEGLKHNETKRFYASIISNGGEEMLPVTIRLVKMAITTPKNTRIVNLEDFFEYANNNLYDAMEIFESKDFQTLLKELEFPNMETYTLLLKEPNRHMALDVFFILAGLKDHTYIVAPKDEIVHLIKPGKKLPIQGNLILEQSDKGYVEATLSIENEVKWLKLYSKSLTSADFSEGMAKIRYRIDPRLIQNRYNGAIIAIKTTNDREPTRVSIVAKSSPLIKVWMPREGYSYKDEGVIVIENQIGSALQIEISCKESFVRFKERRYKVDGQLQIPFSIKLSPMLSARMLFSKIPAMTATIEVKASYRGKESKKNLTLTAGEF